MSRLVRYPFAARGGEVADPAVLLDMLGVVGPKLAIAIPGAAIGIWLTDRIRPERPTRDALRRLAARLSGR
jgi:hypothetical protein